jgi:Mrp family chromosome partitioning ATPase
MSVDIFRASNIDEIAEQIDAERVPIFADRGEWSPEQFAREQIRGLVRQLFFSNAAQPVRQVLFTAAEAGTDVTQLCRQVGVSLASEIKGSVAILSRDMPSLEEAGQEETRPGTVRPRSGEPSPMSLKDAARRIKGNLWLLTEVSPAPNRGPANGALYSKLCELRTEFEYSIVEGAPAGPSSEAAALGQLTDGIVLVLAAHRTRRAAARKIKETLERARIRILGTVLSERTFPIPAALYRRL